MPYTSTAQFVASRRSVLGTPTAQPLLEPKMLEIQPETGKPGAELFNWNKRSQEMLHVIKADRWGFCVTPFFTFHWNVLRLAYRWAFEEKSSYCQVDVVAGIHKDHHCLRCRRFMFWALWYATFGIWPEPNYEIAKFIVNWCGGESPNRRLYQFKEELYTFDPAQFGERFWLEWLVQWHIPTLHYEHINWNNAWDRETDTDYDSLLSDSDSTSDSNIDYGRNIAYAGAISGGHDRHGGGVNQIVRYDHDEPLSDDSGSDIEIIDIGPMNS